MPPETSRPGQRHDGEHAGRFDRPSPFGLAWRAFSQHAPLYIAGLYFLSMCIAMPSEATTGLGLVRIAGSAVLLFCLLYGGRVLIGSLPRLVQAFKRSLSYDMARDERDVPDK